MKDFFGRDLQVGDEVAFNYPSYKYLTLGKVIKLNAKMLRIEYTCRYSGKSAETNEYPEQVVKKV